MAQYRTFEALVEVGKLRQYLDAVHVADAPTRAWPRTRRGTVRVRAERVRPPVPRLRLNLMFMAKATPLTAAASCVVPMCAPLPPTAEDLFTRLTRIAQGAGR